MRLGLINISEVEIWWPYIERLGSIQTELLFAQETSLGRKAGLCLRIKRFLVKGI